VNITIPSDSPAEQEVQEKRPLPNLLVQGFQLALRNWPFVVFAYAVNLVFGLLVSIPFATGLGPYLDHSLAAQRIAGTVDVNYLGELALHLRETSFFQTAMHTATWLNLLQLLVLFFLFAGTVFVYVSAEPPRLSVLLRGGVAYFWRFVRAGILAGCIAGVILGILFAARGLLLSRAGEVYIERTISLYAAISGAVVLLVALLLRLWWDLVEVYIVRNAMDGERSVRQALLPALKLLWRYFFRAVGSFLLSGMLGLGALAVCLYVWKVLPAHQVWIACVVAQVGLFLLLASRFWQRGIEATLVMSADPPIVAGEEIAAMSDEETPAVAAAEVLAGLSEPTLRDLVLKLRNEPWASPEGLPLPPAPRSVKPVPPTDVAPPKLGEPEVSLLDRHATKFPLGGESPAREAEPANAVERPRILEDPDRPPRTGKPLP
jgi:hypothetical protein